MKRCGKCGKSTYHNSHFGREVCPYCGWMEPIKIPTGKAYTIKNGSSKQRDLILCKQP
jgi:phage FluMu protein Com